jgi:DNA-binding NtrC family response regulator
MNHKGQALKKAIEQTKTKKSDLIKRLGISVPTFYSWLNKKDLSDDKINRVTNALGGAASKAGQGPKKKSGTSEAQGKSGVHKGQALRKTIEQSKAKKSDLIRRLGISAPTFYFWLNKKDLSDEKINRVTKALGSGTAGKAAPGPRKKSAKVVKSGAAQARGAGHKGQALKKAIEETKTKKSDLIRRLGISVPTFYSWLNKKDLSDDKINRVKKALGGSAQKAIPAAKKQSKVAAVRQGTNGNGVVAHINDLQRIIINLQQHLIDSLRGNSTSTASAPATRRRRRRKKSSK